MENASRDAAILPKADLYITPSQLLKAPVAKYHRTATLMPNVLWSANNALNLSLCHTFGNSIQLLRYNRMGEYEEAQRAENRQCG